MHRTMRARDQRASRRICDSVRSRAEGTALCKLALCHTMLCESQATGLDALSYAIPFIFEPFFDFTRRPLLSRFKTVKQTKTPISRDAMASPRLFEPAANIFQSYDCAILRVGCTITLFIIIRLF